MLGAAGDGLGVAVGRVDVRHPELRIEAAPVRRAHPAPTMSDRPLFAGLLITHVDQELPPKAALGVRRLRPQMAHLMVEKRERVAANLFPASSIVADFRRNLAIVGLVERATKVSDGLRRPPPTFGGNDLTHVRPRVERLDESREGHRRRLPPELLQILAEPELKRLRRDGLHACGHLTPSAVSGNEFLADIGDRAQADPENGKIEIARHPERPGRRPRPLPVRFEIARLGFERWAVLELSIVGFGWPAWPTVDGDQRPIVPTATHFRLHAELERLHISALAALPRPGRGES